MKDSYKTSKGKNFFNFIGFNQIKRIFFHETDFEFWDNGSDRITRSDCKEKNTV